MSFFLNANSPPTLPLFCFPPFLLAPSLVVRFTFQITSPRALQGCQPDEATFLFILLYKATHLLKPCQHTHTHTRLTRALLAVYIQSTPLISPRCQKPTAVYLNLPGLSQRHRHTTRPATSNPLNHTRAPSLYHQQNHPNILTAHVASPRRDAHQPQAARHLARVIRMPGDDPREVDVFNPRDPLHGPQPRHR